MDKQEIALASEIAESSKSHPWLPLCMSIRNVRLCFHVASMCARYKSKLLNYCAALALTNNLQAC